MKTTIRVPERTFRLDLPFHLLQAIRAAHALMECEGWTVQIPSEHADKFALVRQTFGTRFSVGDGAPVAQGLVRIDHERPSVTVGRLVRPLLFPQAAFDACRRLWRPERDTDFFFSGKMTPQRLAALRAWWERSRPARPARDWERLREGGCLGTRSPLGQLAARLWPGAAGERLVVWSSERGRHWPGKTWDRQYLSRMASSRFAVCPNGDFVWTYRFFEAAMCGAIPVIEDEFPECAGFRFHRMTDDPRSLVWDREAAEANFARCRALLSVPADGLAAELERGLGSRIGEGPAGGSFQDGRA